MAYRARNRGDLLAGIDEFIDKVTVLPPGEWDPQIRLEPPSKLPSQEVRKQSVNPRKKSSVSTKSLEEKKPPVQWSKTYVYIYTCSVNSCVYMGSQLYHVKKFLVYFILTLLWF